MLFREMTLLTSENHTNPQILMYFAVEITSGDINHVAASAWC